MTIGAMGKKLKRSNERGSCFVILVDAGALGCLMGGNLEAFFDMRARISQYWTRALVIG